MVDDLDALVGRTIGTTRGGADDDPLAIRLRDLGARVLTWQTLRYEPTEDDAFRDADVNSYDWIVFTSARAVKETFNRHTPAAGVNVAAVGPQTAKAVEEFGGHPRVVGDGGGAALVETVCHDNDVSGLRVLFPASNRAGSDIQAGFAKAGARVDRFDVYRTVHVPLDASRILLDIAGGVDLVTFASPSAVSSFAHGLGTAWPSALHAIAVIAIGPTTRDALREHGLDGAISAPVPSVDGLIDACVEVCISPKN